MQQLDVTWNERAGAPIKDSGVPLDLGLTERVHLRVDGGPGNLATDVLFVRGNHEDVLIVSLHGYTDRKKYVLPRFERLASLSKLGRHTLYISDPTLKLSSKLGLSWYVGTEDDDISPRLASIISSCARQLGVESIIITGSSGGGFASLAIASLLPGSMAVVFSPQTRIASYRKTMVNNFRKIVFPDFESMEDVEAAYRNRVDMQYVYGMTPGSAWYIQNSGDEDHIRDHMNPFRDRAAGGVEYVLEHHMEGHGPPSRARVSAWVEAAIVGDISAMRE